MKVIIEKQEEKPLVDRIEVVIKAKDFEATPSNAQIQEEISKQLNKPAELIIVKHIYQKFGKSEVRASAYVYNSAEALNKFEPKPKKKKKEAGEKKEAAAEAPAEEKKEAPKEEAKVEAKE